MNNPYPFGKKNYLLILGIIAVAATIGYYFMVIVEPRNNQAPSYILISGIFGVVFILPLLASIVGVFVALFSYQSLAFGQKYFRSFLISLLSLNTIYMAICIFGAIRNTIKFAV